MAFGRSSSSTTPDIDRYVPDTLAVAMTAADQERALATTPVDAFPVQAFPDTKPPTETVPDPAKRAQVWEKAAAITSTEKRTGVTTEGALGKGIEIAQRNQKERLKQEEVDRTQLAVTLVDATGANNQFPISEVILDATTRDNYISIRPEEPAKERKDNARAIVEKLYGANSTPETLVDQVDKLIVDRVTSAKSPVFVDSLKKACDILKPAGIADETDAQTQEVMKEAIYIALSNPKLAERIIKALKGEGEIDLNSIPGFAAILRDVAMCRAFDKYEDTATPPANNIFAPSNPNAKLNRTAAMTAFRDPTAPTVNISPLDAAGVAIASPIVITPAAQNTAKNIFAVPPVIKIDADTTSTTKDSLDAWNTTVDTTNTVFKGILLVAGPGVGRGAEQKLQELERFARYDVATLNRLLAAGLDAITILGDASKSDIVRLTGSMQGIRNIDTILGTPRGRQDRLVHMLSETSHPREAMIHVKEDMMTEALRLLEASAALTGFTPAIRAELQAIIDDPNRGYRDQELQKRVLGMAIADPALARQVAEQMRGIAMVDTFTALAGDPSDLANREKVFALFNYYILNPAGKPGPVLAKELMDAVYATDTAKVSIPITPELRAYLVSLGIATPSAGPLEFGPLKGESSNLAVNTMWREMRAPMLAINASDVWGTLRSGNDVNIRSMLENEFKVGEGESDPAKKKAMLDEAIVRLKNAATGTEYTSLSSIVQSSIDGTIVRESGVDWQILREYIRTGQPIAEIAQANRFRSMDNFLNSVTQTTATNASGEEVPVGQVEGRTNEGILAELQTLEKPSFAAILKSRAPRILKRLAVGLAISAAVTGITIATGGTAVPLFIGGLFKVAAGAGLITSSIGLYRGARNAKSKGAYAAYGASGLAVGSVFSIMATTVAPPLGALGVRFLGDIVGELGASIIEYRAAQRSYQELTTARDNYNTEVEVALDSLRPANESEIRNIYSALGINLSSLTSPLNATTTRTAIDAIKARRTALQQAEVPNFAALDSFQNIITPRVRDQGIAFQEHVLAAKTEQAQARNNVVGLYSGLQVGKIAGGVIFNELTKSDEVNPQNKTTSLIEEQLEVRETAAGIDSESTTVLGVFEENGVAVATVDLNGDGIGDVVLPLESSSGTPLTMDSPELADGTFVVDVDETRFTPGVFSSEETLESAVAFASGEDVETLEAHFHTDAAGDVKASVYTIFEPLEVETTTSTLDNDPFDQFDQIMNGGEVNTTEVGTDVMTTDAADVTVVADGIDVVETTDVPTPSNLHLEYVVTATEDGYFHVTDADEYLTAHSVTVEVPEGAINPGATPEMKLSYAEPTAANGYQPVIIATHEVDGQTFVSAETNTVTGVSTSYEDFEFTVNTSGDGEVVTYPEMESTVNAGGTLWGQATQAGSSLGLGGQAGTSVNAFTQAVIEESGWHNAGPELDALPQGSPWIQYLIDHGVEPSLINISDSTESGSSNFQEYVHAMETLNPDNEPNSGLQPGYLLGHEELSILAPEAYSQLGLGGSPLMEQIEVPPVINMDETAVWNGGWEVGGVPGFDPDAIDGAGGSTTEVTSSGIPLNVGLVSALVGATAAYIDARDKRIAFSNNPVVPASALNMYGNVVVPS